MVNILDLLKGQLGDAAMGKIGDLVGMSGNETSSALGSVLPAVLGGIMSKGSTQSGASGLLDFMKTNEVGGGMFDNLTGLLGDGGKSSALMKIGGLALPFLLGGKQSGFMNLIAKATGLSSGKTSGLLSLAAPMVMGMISKQLGNGGASGLMNLLSGQKGFIKDALPAGMGDMLGFSAPSAPKMPSTPTSTESSSGGGMLKWLLPLLAVLAGVWYFTKDGCATASNQIDETVGTTMDKAADATNAAATTATDAVGNVAEKAGDMASSAAGTVTNAVDNATEKAGDMASSASNDVDGFMIDANGNLLDGSKNVIAAAGTFTEVDGYYVDKDGKRIGKILKKIGQAIGAAGEKTADFFKNKFSNLLSKKSEGVAANSAGYTLTKMTFDPESQKISYFSKAEFEGLASALKASDSGKITVKVHTADGKNERENKRLSSMRAQQIQSMLQALGVKEKQMSFKGMGSGDAAKAASNSIEIDAN